MDKIKLIEFAQKLTTDHQSSGLKFIIGALADGGEVTVQSVVFDKLAWDPAKAHAWLSENDFLSSDADDSNNSFVFTQKNVHAFDQSSLLVINGASDGKLKLFSEFERFTGETEFHVHEYIPTDSFTSPPFGLSGHRHPLERDVDGNVTGFGGAAGHRHGLNEFELEFGADFFEESFEMAAHMGGKSKKVKRKKLTQTSEALTEYAEGDLHTLEGVEIFKTGVWNKDKYTIKDLDDMVDAFSRVGFTPAIKLGHEKATGARAWGWVDSIRRVGESLIADFRDITDDVYQIIKEHGFDRVSSEVFWDFERNGITFRRVLSAVALLGSEVPAVDLLPLRDATLNSVPDSFGRKFLYEMKLEEVDMSKVDDLTAEVEKLQGELKTAKTAEEEAQTKLATAEEAKKGVKAATEASEAATNAIAELETKLGEAQTILKDEAKVNKATSDKVTELTAELEASRAAIKALTSRADKADEEARKTRISGKLEKLTIPAFRPHLAALYELVTTLKETKLVTFSVDKDNSEELDGETIVDKFVETLNKTGAKLFKQLSMYTDEGKLDPNAETEETDAKVHELATVYMKESGEKDIGKAYAHILAENEDLRIAYAKS